MIRTRNGGFGYRYLEPDEVFDFPDVESAVGPGIVAVGGNLSPGMLLSAYRQGLFPWYSPGEPIMWWAPDPRFVLYPTGFHVSRRLARRIRSGSVKTRLDTDFATVIRRCAEVPRRGQDGTWITPEMEDAYLELHNRGYAHSVETYLDGALVGGLYGVCLGRAFFGESMFHLEPDASKVALARLVEIASERSFLFVDCQVQTPHLASLGAVDISRAEFMDILALALDAPDDARMWTNT